MNLSRELAQIWAIQKQDSGDFLGTRDRFSSDGISFGARVPAFWPTKAAAQTAWLSYCMENEYIVRGVSLGGVGKVYQTGPNFSLMPSIQFTMIGLLEIGFELPTLYDLHINTGENNEIPK